MSSEFSFSDARAHLTDIANKVAYKGERAVITRKGRKLIALVSIEDLEILEAIENQMDLDDAKEALTQIEKEGTIAWEILKHKLSL
jgi:prevent-host-death family protein